MVKLGDFTGPRNNFTLLRLLFAMLVLFGHSSPISGNGADPLSELIRPYPWIGHIAVSGFFAISGYLVTASFVKRGAAAFMASRALRLYPAIIVYSLVAILVIGPLASDVPVAQYFQSRPWQNMYNSTLWEWIYNLPHAFDHNPMPGSTNGATWTLPVELRCYIAVLVMGFFGMLDSRMRANVAIVLLLYWIRVRFASIPLFGSEPRMADPVQFFLIGALLWVNRKNVPLNWPLGLIAVVMPYIGMKYHFFTAAYTIGWSYLVLLLAYRTPHVDLDRYGDISYGVYIYAWPMQQLVWRPGQSATTNFLLASSIVIPVACLSWLLVEKPAMRLRRYLRRFDAPRPPAADPTADTTADVTAATPAT